VTDVVAEEEDEMGLVAEGWRRHGGGRGGGRGRIRRRSGRFRRRGRSRGGARWMAIGQPRRGAFLGIELWGCGCLQVTRFLGYGSVVHKVPAFGIAQAD
jgi:hypothetical protein